MPISTQPIEDWGEAIFLALTNAVNTLLAAIPGILGAIIILIIGWLLSGVIARLVSGGLRAVGADRMFATHGADVYGQRAQSVRPSVVGGELAKWAIRIVFLIAAANVLGMPQVSLLLNQVLLWLPNLLVAAIILLVAPLIGRFVRGLIETGAGSMGFTNAPVLGRVAEIGITAFAVLIAINQVGIAGNLVNILFIGVVGALALAFGLAFGMGGRDVAAQMTQQWYESSRSAAQRVKEKADLAGSTAQRTPAREARVTSAASMRVSDSSANSF